MTAPDARANLLRSKRIGVVGGTGEQGRGLASRWVAAGLEVVIGSRDGARAAEIAAGIGAAGGTNVECAATSDIVVIAVPWDGHRSVVAELAPHLVGKIVIDCVNPLGFDGKGAFALGVPEGSAVEQAQQLLPESRVVGAFHHISAVLLLDPEVASLDTDVMVVGDDREATDVAQALADLLPGVRGVYAGRARNAHQVEALTANLISVNRRYKVHAGVRVTDLPTF